MASFSRCRRVADHRRNPLGVALGIAREWRRSPWCLDVERLGDGRFIVREMVVQRLEGRPVQQVGNADAAPADLVLVAGTDAAGGGADRIRVRTVLRNFLRQPVEREDHVRAVADRKLAATSTPAASSVSISSIRAAGSITTPLPMTARIAGPQNAAGNQLQDEFLVADVDRVAGVMSALIARDDVEPVGEKVDHLAFSLIAPLGAQIQSDYSFVWHDQRYALRLRDRAYPEVSHCIARCGYA